MQGWQPKSPPKACFRVTLGEPHTSHRRQCASGERPTGGRKNRDKSEPDSQHNKTDNDSWKGCQKPAKKKLSCFHDRPAGVGHPTRACQAVYGRSPTTVPRRDAPGHRPSPRWHATSHWERGLPDCFFFFRQTKCYGVQGVRPEPADPPNPKNDQNHHAATSQHKATGHNDSHKLGLPGKGGENKGQRKLKTLLFFFLKKNENEQKICRLIRLPIGEMFLRVARFFAPIAGDLHCKLVKYE